VTAGLSAAIPAGLDRLHQEFPKVSKLRLIDLTELPHRREELSQRDTCGGEHPSRLPHLSARRVHLGVLGRGPRLSGCHARVAYEIQRARIVALQSQWNPTSA
jgi:hypothetical protein